MSECVVKYLKVNSWVLLSHIFLAFFYVHMIFTSLPSVTYISTRESILLHVSYAQVGLYMSTGETVIREEKSMITLRTLLGHRTLFDVQSTLHENTAVGNCNLIFCCVMVIKQRYY